MALWRRLALHNNRLAWCFPISISLKGDIITDTRPHLLIAGRWKKVVEPSVTTTGIVGGVVTVRNGNRDKYHKAETSNSDPDYTTVQALYQSKETVITDTTYSPMTSTWDLNVGGAVNSVDNFPITEYYDSIRKDWERVNPETNKTYLEEMLELGLTEEQLIPDGLEDIPQTFKTLDGKPYGIDGIVYEIGAHAAIKYSTTVKTIFKSSIKPSWTKSENYEGYLFGIVSSIFDESGKIIRGEHEDGESISVEMTWHTDTSVEKRYYEPIDDVGFVSATKTA